MSCKINCFKPLYFLPYLYFTKCLVDILVRKSPGLIYKLAMTSSCFIVSRLIVDICAPFSFSPYLVHFHIFVVVILHFIMQFFYVSFYIRSTCTRAVYVLYDDQVTKFVSGQPTSAHFQRNHTSEHNKA